MEDEDSVRYGDHDGISLSRCTYCRNVVIYFVTHIVMHFVVSLFEGVLDRLCRRTYNFNITRVYFVTA